MTQAIRKDLPVSYKTTIKRTLVDALRAVFTDFYGEEQFQNLNISTQYPLAEIEYPSIFVRFDEGGIYNAGVGHVEYFFDQSGVLREWKHRRYEGEIEFVICALSPLDRDVLSDALIEILSFGGLDPLLAQFGYRIYGDPTQQYSILNAMHQISLNTDEIMSSGETQAIAPWEPEDVLVYQTSYTCECHGGFYNTQVQTPVRFISSVDLQGYLYSDPDNPSFDVDAAGLPFPQDGNMWTYPFLFVDEATIASSTEISAVFVDLVLVVPTALADALIPGPTVAQAIQLVTPFAQAGAQVPPITTQSAVTSTATAAAQVPAVAANNLLSPVFASASAQAPAPSLAIAMSASVSATALANTPLLTLALPTPFATATTSAPTPVLHADCLISAPAAAAIGSAPPISFAADGVISIAPVIATASIPAPTLAITSTLAANPAAATAKAPTPDPVIPLVTASASVPLPTIAITGAIPPAAATASVPQPLFIKVVLSPVASATASSPASTISIASIVSATAAASIPTVLVTVTLLPAAATATASVPTPTLGIAIPAQVQAFGFVPTVVVGETETAASVTAAAAVPTPIITITIVASASAGAATSSPIGPALGSSEIPGFTEIGPFGTTILMTVPAPAGVATAATLPSLPLQSPAATAAASSSALVSAPQLAPAATATASSINVLVGSFVTVPSGQAAASVLSVTLLVTILPPSATAAASSAASLLGHSVLGVGVPGTIILGNP